MTAPDYYLPSFTRDGLRVFSILRAATFHRWFTRGLPRAKGPPLDAELPRGAATHALANSKTLSITQAASVSYFPDLQSTQRSIHMSTVSASVHAQILQMYTSIFGSQDLRDAPSNLRGGQFWSAGWSAYVTFLRDVCGWENPTLADFAHEEAMTKSCSDVWWHEDVLVIVDRPEILARDNEGRMHAETGPSMRYRDGWSLYNWHGVAIPAEWIENKESLSPKTALTWDNIEQRRAACEILGWQRILRELDAVVIQKDEDPEIGTLLEVELPDSGKERFLQVVCGTGRVFALPVPKEMRTALEANAWTFGLDARTYKPEVRT